MAACLSEGLKSTTATSPSSRSFRQPWPVPPSSPVAAVGPRVMEKRVPIRPRASWLIKSRPIMGFRFSCSSLLKRTAKIYAVSKVEEVLLPLLSSSALEEAGTCDRKEDNQDKGEKEGEGGRSERRSAAQGENAMQCPAAGVHERSSDRWT